MPAERIEIARSTRLACALGAAHLCALVVAAVMAQFAPWLWTLFAVVLMSGFDSLDRHVLMVHAGAALALELTAERECAVRTRGGAWLHGRVMPSSYVLPWLVVLHLEVPGRLTARKLVLLPDAIAADTHRRLRVRLRWAKYGDDDVDRRGASL